MNYPLPGSSSHDTPIAAVGTAYATEKKATLLLPKSANRNFTANLGGLWIWMSSISGAAKITFRISLDAAGDEMLVTDTEADPIYTGTTTAADGSVVYSLNGLPVDLSIDTLYVFAKVDAGTVTIDKVQLSWGF
jgi:hypothetical protein